MTGVVLPPSSGLDQLSELLAQARSTEIPAAATSLALARLYYEGGEFETATEWCLRVTDGGDDYRTWYSAAQLLNTILEKVQPTVTRTARVAIVGSYTTNQLADLLRLFALRRGIYLDVYQPGYNQYRQEILDGASNMYLFNPEVVLLAVDHREVSLPTFSDHPAKAVTKELSRWTSLWKHVEARCDATIVQTNFVIPADDPFGHLSSRLPGSRMMMLHELNRQLGEAAGDKVVIVDNERLAGLHGKARWHDPRYWVLAKLAVSLEALPVFTRHLVAVLAASFGLGRKCLVLDLDGTLWGGVVGEDGVEGIKLGGGPIGEAFVAFQDYVLALKQRGIILAVCSKNDDATAKEPFELHLDMRIKLDDIAAFVANWEPKPDNMLTIAQMLDLSTEALAFVDDQPAERATMRAALPEVDVITLPSDPAYYTTALGSYPFFESGGYTDEDQSRAAQYRSRALFKEAEKDTSSLKEFLAGLDMRAVIGDFDQLHLTRVLQLIGKTNQFNLTNHRHPRAAVERMMSDSGFVCFYMKLSDRLADHGLVGVVIGEQVEDLMVIDTMLLSCRVIGRTAEATMLDHLYARSRDLGCTTVRGIYSPSSKNQQVADLYQQHGYVLVSKSSHESIWELPLLNYAQPSPLITVVR